MSADATGIEADASAGLITASITAPNITRPQRAERHGNLLDVNKNLSENIIKFSFCYTDHSCYTSFVINSAGLPDRAVAHAVIKEQDDLAASKPRPQSEASFRARYTPTHARHAMSLYPRITRIDTCSFMPRHRSASIARLGALIVATLFTLATGTLLSPLCAAGVTTAPDTIRIGINVMVPGLDPTISPSEGIRVITYDNIYEGLTRLDESGHVMPLLAHDWEVSDDGLHYQFSLVPGVRFHDGTPMDCASVRYSLSRAIEPDSKNPLANTFHNIAAIECPDALQVAITLKKRHFSFLYELALADASIISPQTAPTNAEHPVGTGPYMFGEWVRGNHVTLQRNPRYWGKPPFFQTAIFRFFSTASAATQALINGELDAYPRFPVATELAQIARDPQFRIKPGLAPFKVLLALNNARAPFNDLRFRQALAYGIDRQHLVQNIDLPGVLVIGSHMSPEDPEYINLDHTYVYDPDRARALLAQLALPAGTTLHLTLPPTNYARIGSAAIVADLGKLGLHVDVETLTWPEWLSHVLNQHDFDMTIVAHTEPHDMAVYTWPNYYFGYHNARFNALYAQYEAAADPDQRRGLSAAMQVMLATDVPNIFLFFTPRSNVWSVHLRGVWNNSPAAAFPLGGVTWSP